MESKFIRIKDFIFNINNIVCIEKEEVGEMYYINILLQEEETRYIKYRYESERDKDFENINSRLKAI